MYSLENSTESLRDAVIFDLAFDAVVGLRFTKNCSLFRLIGSKRDCDAEHKRVATNHSLLIKVVVQSRHFRLAQWALLSIRWRLPRPPDWPVNVYNTRQEFDACYKH